MVRFCCLLLVAFLSGIVLSCVLRLMIVVRARTNRFVRSRHVLVRIIGGETCCVLSWMYGGVSHREQNKRRVIIVAVPLSGCAFQRYLFHALCNPRRSPRGGGGGSVDI